MNLLILSDSHGNIENMHQAVLRSRPDALIHLGDCCRDAHRLQDRHPDLPLYQVAGNCDFDPITPREQIITLCGHRILLCHGDRYGVKQGLGGLRGLAQREDVELILFGHTHIPCTDWAGRTLLLNPGSIGMPRKPGQFSYALIRLVPDQPIHTRLHLLSDRI